MERTKKHIYLEFNTSIRLIAVERDMKEIYYINKSYKKGNRVKDYKEE